MRVKKSNKVINGVQCYDVVNGGKIIKTFISKLKAQAFVVDNKIEKYTNSKAYKKDMAFINYYVNGDIG